MAAAAMTLQANAQGANTRMGGNDGDYQSLAERITGLEKKNDAFNVYFNYAASARASEQDGTWETGFANKQLRAITDTSKFYRRAKAFLLKEIDISFSGTIFGRCNTIEAKNFIKYTREMVKRNRETMEALDALD